MQSPRVVTSDTLQTPSKRGMAKLVVVENAAETPTSAATIQPMQLRSRVI